MIRRSQVEMGLYMWRTLRCIRNPEHHTREQRPLTVVLLCSDRICETLTTCGSFLAGTAALAPTENADCQTKTRAQSWSKTLDSPQESFVPCSEQHTGLT